MTKTRKIQKIGDSHYVSLPPKWVRKNKLKKGDKLLMDSDETSVTFSVQKFKGIVYDPPKFAESKFPE